MNKTSLETAFNSYFHNKHSFQDFLNININNEYKQIFYSKNTFSPSKKLKQFQQFLNLFIFDHVNINKNVVFSYRKGVSTIDAIKPHKNKKFIYTTEPLANSNQYRWLISPIPIFEIKKIWEYVIIPTIYLNFVKFL